MKIAWNKVTWYSKFIALVLFVVLPFWGFWLGIQYGETMASATSVSSPTGSAPAGVATTSVATLASNHYFADTAGWQTDSRFDGGFSISYPLGFQAQDNYATTQSTDWRLDANGTPGIKFFTLTIPSIFEPQTNFADATLTVGDSRDATAVADCLTPDQSGSGTPAANGDTTTINGTSFTIFKFSGAGAGNIYDTTSYRTVHAGACYAVEYTIHSSQIANYPPQYGLQPFNEPAVAAVLDRIVNTFQLP